MTKLNDPIEIPLKGLPWLRKLDNEHYGVMHYGAIPVAVISMDQVEAVKALEFPKSVVWVRDTLSMPATIKAIRCVLDDAKIKWAIWVPPKGWPHINR